MYDAEFSCRGTQPICVSLKDLKKTGISVRAITWRLIGMFPGKVYVQSKRLYSFGVWSSEGDYSGSHYSSTLVEIVDSGTFIYFGGRNTYLFLQSGLALKMSTG